MLTEETATSGADKGCHVAPDVGSARLSLTVIILSRDEEIHIARCLESIADLAERIVVVDSGSTDRTLEIARSRGAEVYQRAWKNHADQFQWALENTGVRTEWVLRLDCDEYLQAGLKAEITRRLSNLPAEVTGVELKLRVVFRNQFIRWGGYYRTWLLRLWRTKAGRVRQRWMDEHILLDHGRSVRMTGGDLVDHNLNDIGWWTEKHNRYATRHMVDFISLEHGLGSADADKAPVSPGGRWKLFLRNRLFGGAPLYLRSVLYFAQRYVLRLGFLDGRQGFVWHFLQGFWYFVLIDAKIDEARHYIDEHGLTAFRDHVRAKHGIEL